MPARVRDVIKLIESHGWQQVAQRGSHRQFKHDKKTGRVTIAGVPNKEVPTGTLRSILKQAGLTPEDMK